MLLLFVLFRGGLGEIFKKPHSFYADDSHNSFFRRVDADRDGVISRAEFAESVGAGDLVFNYLLNRAKLSEDDPEYAFQLREHLSYREFMWFYRESDLFEDRKLMPPELPEKLYSFPHWPGMKGRPILEVPSDITPSKFWADYVIPHKTVVIRKALEGSAALANWSDEEYLISRFGDLEAKLEHKLESRGDSLAGKIVKSGRATVRDIVEKKVDGYIVSVVPQPMAWEVNVPSCVLCGRRDRPYLDISSSYSFITEIEETSLWISRGRTRSQFHYDKENTLNCLVSGKPKDWVILDTRKYGNKVPWVRGGGYNISDDMDTLYTDWVAIDVDNLDLSLHAYLLEANFEVLTQYPGDCVFLPYSILHYAGHLVTDDTLQVAVSFMWLPGTQYNEKCDIDLKKSIPLAVFDTVWYYSGLGAVPQGNHNPRQLAEAITPIGPDGKRVMNMMGVLSFLPPGTRSTDKGLDEVVRLLELVKTLIDKNVSPPLDLWLQLAAVIDLNGLGCNEGERYIPRPLEEMNKMFSFLKNW